MLLAGFDIRRIEAGEIALNVATAGNGPPLLLLHGFPETHLAWHAVAPRLAESFSVVCPDLRGYGDSDKPPGDPDHDSYAKRTMARDLLLLMRALGHERFAVAGHDRGALVGFRLALDHPRAISHLTASMSSPRSICGRRSTARSASRPIISICWRSPPRSQSG